MTMSVRQSRKAFTLIELLVVIAIIALLAAILFPVFARARENARKSSCANNLKQIGLGLQQYAQDYDETLTRGWYGPDNGCSDATQRYKWQDAVFPYVKSEQLYNCPSHSTTARYRFRNACNYGSYPGNVSYWGQLNPGGPMLKSLPDIETPAETVWATDGEWFETAWQDLATDPDYPTSMTMAGGYQAINNVRARHLESVNVVFVDGHVKSMSMARLFAKRGAAPNDRLYLWTIQRD